LPSRVGHDKHVVRQILIQSAERFLGFDLLFCGAFTSIDVHANANPFPYGATGRA
jgi:hypothetical protein